MPRPPGRRRCPTGVPPIASIPGPSVEGFRGCIDSAARPLIPVPAPTPVRAPRRRRRATFSGRPRAGRARAGEAPPASVAPIRVQGVAGRGSEQLGSHNGEGGKGDGGLDADNPLQDAKLGFRGERFEVGARHCLSGIGRRCNDFRLSGFDSRSFEGEGGAEGVEGRAALMPCPFPAPSARGG